MNKSTIAAISTAQGEGGIGVIRISGENALEIADKIFIGSSGKKPSEMKGYTASFGKVCDSEGEIDEAVLLVFKAPHSYTGENVAEISCHGGLYLTKRVLRAAFSAGAFPAEAGEFTKRAFLNGKIDLTEAEAVIDLITAKSKGAARAALCVKEGAVRKKIEGVKHQLLDIAAHLSAWADYPEDDIAQVTDDMIIESCKKAKAVLKELISTYDGGQAIKQGIDTVIAGKPNVGKSTLMNLLAGCEKSIVTEIPGTTRDVVEDTVLVGDVILRLSDTAGLRDTTDTVEKIGVELARKRLSQCSLLLAVFDNSRELDSEDKKLIELASDLPCIAVINKTDLENTADISYISQHINKIVYISASNGTGRQELVSAIEELAGVAQLNPSEGILSNERQRLAVSNALGSIEETLSALSMGITYDAVTVSIEDAISELMELTGEVASEEIIDRVFHNFCVGK